MRIFRRAPLKQAPLLYISVGRLVCEVFGEIFPVVALGRECYAFDVFGKGVPVGTPGGELRL